MSKGGLEAYDDDDDDLIKFNSSFVSASRRAERGMIADIDRVVPVACLWKLTAPYGGAGT